MRYLPWERGHTPNWDRGVAFSACFPLLSRAKKLACAHQLERCIGGMHSCSSCRWARAPNCSYYKRKRPFYMPCLLANIFSASQKKVSNLHMLGMLGKTCDVEAKSLAVKMAELVAQPLLLAKLCGALGEQRYRTGNIHPGYYSFNCWLCFERLG